MISTYIQLFSWVIHFFPGYSLLTHPSTKFDFWHVPTFLRRIMHGFRRQEHARNVALDANVEHTYPPPPAF